MKKLLFLLALLCLFAQGAWALEPFQFASWAQPSNGQAFWTAWTAQNGLHRINAPLYKQQENVVFETEGNLKVTFTYSDGTKRLDIIGVDLLKDGTVVKHDYHAGYTGHQASANIYTLSNIEAGTYTIRYWVPLYDNNHEASTDSQGSITNEYSGTCNTTFAVTGWTNRITEWTASQNPPNDLRTVMNNQNFGPNTNMYIYNETGVKFYEAGTFNVTYAYTGNAAWGLDFRGIEILDDEGNIATYDYHEGFAGGTPRNSTYIICIPQAGTYTIRHIAYSTRDMTDSNNCKGNITYTCTSNPYYADQYALDYAVDKNVVRVGCPFYTDEVKNTYSNLNGGKITAENHTAYATALASLSCTLPEDGYYRVKSMKSRYLFDDGANGVSKLNNGATNSKYIYKIDFNQETQKLVSMTNSLGTSATGKASSSAAVVNIADRDVRFAKDDNTPFRADQLWIAGMNVNTSNNAFNITSGTAYNTSTNPHFLINWGSSSDNGQLKDEGNRWTFEPIEAGKIYTINVVGADAANVSVTYTGNGYEGNTTVNGNGFFYFESAPSESAFDLHAPSGYTASCSVNTENKTITVNYAKDVIDPNTLIEVTAFDEGQMIRLKGNNNKYIGCDAFNSQAENWNLKLHDGQDDWGILYVKRQAHHPAGNTTITDYYYQTISGYKNGLYLDGIYQGSIDKQHSSAQFILYKSQTGDEYYLKHLDENKWISCENGEYITSTSQLTSECALTMEDVETIPVTMYNIKGREYASFFAPFDVTLPDGYTAYSIEMGDYSENPESSRNDVPLKRIDENGKIAAGYGAIIYKGDVEYDNTKLYTTKEVRLTIGEYGVGDSGNWYDYLLSGSTYTNTASTATTFNDYLYAFNFDSNGVVGFYYSTYINGFKAFIAPFMLGEGGFTRSFTLNFDGLEQPTFIDSITTKDGSSKIYGIDGCLRTASKSGVNIVNGKKVILK